MPNLAGHAVAGMPYIIIGLWHIVQVFRRFYKAKATRSEFKVTGSYSPDFLCGRLKNLPVDGTFKLLASTLGLVTELTHSHDPNGEYDSHVTHHSIVYTTYGLAGIVDLLVFFRVPLPEGTDFLSFALALMVEAILFKGHLAGRPPLDVLTHGYTIYLPALAALAILLEVTVCRRHFLATVAKGYFLLLLGTWFWQIGILLYNPLPGTEKWDQFDNDNLMLATAIFCVHAIVNFFIVVTIGTLIAWRHGQAALSGEQGKVRGQGFMPLMAVHDNSCATDGD